MRTTSPKIVKKSVIRMGAVALGVVLLFSFVLSACTSDAQRQQQISQSKQALDQAIVHAQSIGVPDAMLHPIMNQAGQLNKTNAPITVFNDQLKVDYFSNVSTRYQLLTTQVKGLEVQVTQQLDYKASQDLQAFEEILAQRQAQGFVEAKTFADQLKQDQALMAQATLPKQYVEVSNNARTSAQALHLLGTAYDGLTSLQKTLKQLQASRIDVTALNMMVDNDVDLFRNATTPDDFNTIIDLVNAQQQQTVTLSTQAIPYVGAAKLKEFSKNIDLLKQYGGQKTDTYQKRLNADQNALDRAKTVADFLKVSSQIDADVASIRVPMLQAQANYLVQQFHKEVNSWGNAHQYHDSYNGQSYPLAYEYDQQGIGSDLDDALNTAQNPDDFQGVIDLANNNMRHLKAMQADYADKTPWDQPHDADMQLMQFYQAKTGQTMIVSLVEQTLRFYQDGKLVRAFQITSGQYDKPSPPGIWHIFNRESPTKFKSSEPKGSAFWYPDTKINFAMEYRIDGYFIHDSWWRLDYGPGTNFPHIDSGGDQSFSGNGSHGCINMQEDQANWLYHNTDYGAALIIY